MSRPKKDAPAINCDCTKVSRELMKAGQDVIAEAIRGHHREGSSHVWWNGPKPVGDVDFDFPSLSPKTIWSNACWPTGSRAPKVEDADDLS